MNDILDLAGLCTTHRAVDETAKIVYIYAEISNKKNNCQCCAESNLYRAGSRNHSYRDLPLQGYQSVIVVKQQRYRCRKCGRSFVQNSDVFHDRHSMTNRCVNWIRQIDPRESFSQIAKQIGCSAKTVRAIVYDHIAEQQVDYRPSMPKWLRIDEVYLKGKSDGARCILVDIENRKLIDVLANCGRDTVVAWLSSVDDNHNLRGVSMDMCENYRAAVIRTFPSAEIVVDRSHVLRRAITAVDQVRIRARKECAEEQNSPKWKEIRLLLRKRRRDLSLEEWQTLVRWMTENKELATAYALKEEFVGIYDCKKRRDAEIAIEAWERSIPEHMYSAFKGLLRVLKTWRKEILAYFGNGETIAYTEAIKIQIEKVNRLGRGCSFEILRGKLLFGQEVSRSFTRGQAA